MISDLIHFHWVICAKRRIFYIWIRMNKNPTSQRAAHNKESIHAKVLTYPQTSDVRRTLIGNTIVDHSDVAGISPVGVAPTTSPFSTWHLASIECTNTTARRDEKHWSYGLGASYIRGLAVRWYFLSHKHNYETRSIEVVGLVPLMLEVWRYVDISMSFSGLFHLWLLWLDVCEDMEKLWHHRETRGQRM